MAKDKKTETKTVSGENFIKLWIKCLEEGKDREWLTEAAEKTWPYFANHKDSYAAVTQKCYQLNAIIAKKTKTAENPSGKKLKLPKGRATASKHGVVSRFVEDNVSSWSQFLEDKPSK